MKRMSRLPTVLLLGLASICGARAEAAPTPAWLGEGSFFLGRPSAAGAVVAASAMFKLSEEREWLVGPKLGALSAWGDGGAASGADAKTRFDLFWGVSETLWVANAFGGGVDVEAVAPSTITGEQAAFHYRVVPSLAVRLFHQGEQGAWAARVGVPYDTHYKWGVELGVTLQLNGVARRGL